MAYQKKKIPREVRWLRKRLERFQYIIDHYGLEDTELLKDGEDHLEKIEETVNRYNRILSEADDLHDDLNKQVDTARDIHKRLRLAVISAFGNDSIEYQQIGGVRQSDIDYSRKNKPNKSEPDVLTEVKPTVEVDLTIDSMMGPTSQVVSIFVRYKQKGGAHSGSGHHRFLARK